MKFLKTTLLGTALAVLFSGCVAKSPSKSDAVDETLPIVSLTQNGTIADYGSIALEWQMIQDPRVEGIYIFRLDSSKGGLTPSDNDYYATISDRFSTHFVDKKIESSKQYGYYFKTYSKNSISRASAIATINSMPPLESVSWIHAQEGMPRSVKLLWRPHPSEKTKAYIIQRKTLDSSRWSDVATVNGRLSAEYIDRDLKDNFTYMYRIKVITFDNLESLPSQEVSVVTKPLPSSVAQVSATTNLPKKIRLDWQHQKSDDFLTYRVYRSNSLKGSYDMLVDTKENYYIDSVDEDGKEYFYKISVFDKDKLESSIENSTAMGKSLQKPQTPSISEAKIEDGRVKITWSSSDPRIKSFSIEKKHKKSLFENKITQIDGIKLNEFYDTHIENDQTYTYKVFSIDENGIRSKPSIEIEIKVKNVMINQTPPPLQQPQQIQQKSVVPQSKKVPIQDQLREVIKDEPIEEVVVPLKDFN